MKLFPSHFKLYYTILFIKDLLSSLEQVVDGEENQDVIEIRPMLRAATVDSTATPSLSTTASAATLPLPSNPSKSVQTRLEVPTREELHRDLLAQSERIIYLETSLYAAEAEKMTLQGMINNGRIAYGQLYNAYVQLKQHGVTVYAEYEQKINELQSEVDELRKGKFAETRVKSYKDLGESARTKFKRKFRDAFVSEINEAVKKRGLEVVHVEMRDKNDGEDKIRVNAQKSRTFNELTPLEKQQAASRRHKRCEKYPTHQQQGLRDITLICNRSRSFNPPSEP